MKNNIKNIIISGILMASVCVGCADVLNKNDLSAVTEYDVWNDGLYAKAYLDKLCRDNLPAWNSGESGNSDESHDGNAIMYGELTTASINEWPYEQIRNINILLANVEKGSIDPETQTVLKAQALVLRAWRYFGMVKRYGGVPMIMTPQDLNEDLYVTRTRTSECIRLIIQDLDDAASVLPWQWTGEDAGRITRAAAVALKARVLLYWASPQFNPAGNRERWNEAYIANKYAREELEKNGYGLYENFEQLWFEEMNKEVVFVQRYQDPGRNHNWDSGTRPYEPASGYATGHHPTLELVESFPMKDGRPVTESPDYDPARYWLNRDPRFAQTVAYNSCVWELPNATGTRMLDKVRLWTFSGYEANGPTPTGFYFRKACNPSYGAYEIVRSSTDWIEIRYAEVMLNYAECAAETGQLGEALDVLKQIRRRAGILAGNSDLYGLKTGMTQAEMIAAIMLERKVEFAAEGKRYWDLRRRRLFADELNGKRRHRVYNTLLIPMDDFMNVKDQVDWNQDYSVYFEDTVDELDKTNVINFRDNYYFYAIPNTHLERNSRLEQTQGWENGTFNPLE
ncbi:MAG: RagB/SusD family nutrient uptake outer membrane protein [Bacteroidales bacterium]|jgi:hypothetical protein|nr:RagB/SusD family nutrient uptake outer membrane protein [Bacteroidales bacterium]